MQHTARGYMQHAHAWAAGVLDWGSCATAQSGDVADHADGDAAISTLILALSETGLRTAVHVLTNGHLERDGTTREARGSHTSFVLHVDVGGPIGTVAKARSGDGRSC